MFSGIALVAVVGLALLAGRTQRSDSDRLEDNAKQARQDLRIVAYLLAAILVMLGIIADRMH